MSGEKTNLYNPVLALIIVGFILESLSGGVRILLSGADHAYPIVLISANAVSLLSLVIALFIFISAMAVGGPVILPLPVQAHPAGTCENGFLTLNVPYCRTNPQDCDQFKDECLKGQGGMPSINHHCNAAMAFLVIAIGV